MIPCQVADCCPFCGTDEILLDVYTDNGLSVAYCCHDARESPYAFEDLYGESLEDVVARELGVDRKRIVGFDHEDDSLVVYRLQDVRLAPEDQREAFETIDRHHGHLDRPVGWKVGLAVYNGHRQVGVAIVGRPVSRVLDQRGHLEVTRVCCYGPASLRRNAASKLYGAAVRVARELNATALVTYTLEGQTGGSVKAAGFVEDGKTKGGRWSCPSRPRTKELPSGPKTRWIHHLK